MKFLITVAAAVVLAGCSDSDVIDNDANMRGLLRARLNQDCMARLPAGPQKTMYNDWDEVVRTCTETSFYQSNHCKDPELCLRALFPETAKATETGTAKTEGLGAKHDGAVP